MFTLKSNQVSAISFILNENNWEKAQQAFSDKAEKYLPFQGTPFVLDVSVFNAEQCDDEGLASFVQLLRQHGLSVIALQHDYEDLSDCAKQLNCLFFGQLPESWAELLASQFNNQSSEEPEQKASEEEKEEVLETPATENPLETEKSPDETEQASENSNEKNSDENEVVEESISESDFIHTTEIARRTVVIETPVRSGQQIYAEDADLIVLGRVSAGAELIADGNIHVYAPMYGRALAGDKGDKSARIFIQFMQAELVSIAGIFRNFEQQLPTHLHQHAVRIELLEDRLSISAMDIK